MNSHIAKRELKLPHNRKAGSAKRQKRRRSRYNRRITHRMLNG